MTGTDRGCSPRCFPLFGRCGKCRAVPTARRSVAGLAALVLGLFLVSCTATPVPSQACAPPEVRDGGYLIDCPGGGEHVLVVESTGGFGVQVMTDTGDAPGYLSDWSLIAHDAACDPILGTAVENGAPFVFIPCAGAASLTLDLNGPGVIGVGPGPHVSDVTLRGVL